MGRLTEVLGDQAAQQAGAPGPSGCVLCNVCHPACCCTVEAPQIVSVATAQRVPDQACSCARVLLRAHRSAEGQQPDCSTRGGDRRLPSSVAVDAAAAKEAAARSAHLQQVTIGTANGFCSMGCSPLDLQHMYMVQLHWSAGPHAPAAAPMVPFSVCRRLTHCTLRCTRHSRRQVWLSAVLAACRTSLQTRSRQLRQEPQQPHLRTH